MVDKSGELSDLIIAISKKFKYKLSNDIENVAPDLSIKDINLIDFIGSAKKTMGEIAQEMDLTPGTVTLVVDKLISKGYLKRERDEGLDRRKVFISLDEKGVKVNSFLLKQRVDISKSILSSLSDYDQDKVLEIFKRINEGLSKND